jgi:hypothetical protein
MKHPHIKYYDDCFTPEFCADVIERFEQNKDQQRLGRVTKDGVNQADHVTKPNVQTIFIDHKSPRATGIFETSPPENSEWTDISKTIKAVGSQYFNNRYINDVYAEYGDFFNRKILGHPLELFQSLVIEEIRLKRYDQGISFHSWHQDASPNGPTITRVLAFQLYFNDVEQGGETEFGPWQDYLKIKPVAGRMVIFPTNWMYMHRGCVPLSGPKYSANFYLRLDPKVFLNPLQEYDTSEEKRRYV